MSSAGDRELAEWLQPGRLWSLWEMLEFHAARFVTLCQAVSAARINLNYLHDPKEHSEEVKEQSIIGRLLFAGASNELTETKKILDASIKSGRVALEELLDVALKSAVEDLKDLGMAVTLIEVERVHSQLHESLPTEAQLDSISSRIRDELQTRLFLSVSWQKAHYYTQQALFGAQVAATFPTVAYEIEEAGKCFALERYTASAVHSIRCLEGGIRALSRCLGIPDPTRAKDRNWGALLRTLKEAIDAKWPGSSDRLSGDGECFDNAYAALAAMQNPWRNATMHLDQKYTEDEARHTFEIVRGFMTKLANRMDEDGSPRA